MGNLLSSFMGSGHKDTVYLSVTPGVGLELCLIDPQSRQVKAYAVRELAYNETTKDIADYEALKSAVEEMYMEVGVNPRCNVIVNLPVCALGTMNLPLIMAENSIEVSVTSEVEQSYIFRRLEPVVAWTDVNTGSNGGDTRKILYAAMQKPVIENIAAALGALGSTLTSVEISVVSYLRALDYIGYTSAQMKDNITWNLMIVSSTGYSLISMVGKTIVDYYEEPLAIKTFEGDDIYNAINASAQITLMSYPANYLYIISETDMVSAELLSKKIQNAGTVDFLENNTFKKQEVMPVSLEVLPDNVMKISLQAVGCALSLISNYPLHFDFMKDTAKVAVADEPVSLQFGDQTIDLSPTKATQLAFGVLVICAGLLSALAFGVLPGMESAKQSQLSEVEGKVKELETQLQTAEGEQSATGSFDMAKQVDYVLKNNRAKLMNYTAIGTSIPDTVWLTYFMTTDDGLIDVKGAATNVEDVYTFFKNMKDSLINTKLRLYKLQMQSSSVDDVISNDSSSNYEFEITNMEENQLKSLLGITSENGENENAASNAKNGGKAPNNKLLSDKPVQVN
ncbi:PilN domain-containing protein [Spirochaetes bacterium]|uniref:PilN domain-containing protein n=1 Tax=Candidatus Scatousia excrementipullorum TaxID=2840936 RepID=A0A9D9H1K8_9BACT|nr:PilN domain-containing protein [Candidatus Scatousia excrementipullorum]